MLDQHSAAIARRDLQPRWSVSMPALAAVEQLLPVTELATVAATPRRLRGALVAELRERGLRVDDTDACWVLVHRDGLRSELAAHGVVVRDCTSFGLRGIVRIVVPADDDRAGLLDAIDAVL